MVSLSELSCMGGGSARSPDNLLLGAFGWGNLSVAHSAAKDVVGRDYRDSLYPSEFFIIFSGG